MDDAPEVTINQVLFSQSREYILLSTSRGLSVICTRSFDLVLKIETYPDPVMLADHVPGTSLFGAVVGEDAINFQLFNGKVSIGKSVDVEGGRILNFRLNHKRVLVLTDMRFYVFDLRTLQILLVIDRSAEWKKIPSLNLLASSGEYASFVCDGDGGICTLNSFTLFQSRIICPHTSPVTALALDGSVLATASSKGTLIRLFRIPSMELLCVFRRGRTESPIKSLELTGMSWLCVTGESDTAHIFKLPKFTDEASSFRLALGAALKYFPQHYKESLEAVRDFAFVKLETGIRFSTAWVDDTVIVVSEKSGFAFVYLVNTQKGGDCKLLSEYALLATTAGISPVAGENTITPKQLSPVKDTKIAINVKPGPSPIKTKSSIPDKSPIAKSESPVSCEAKRRPVTTTPTSASKTNTQVSVSKSPTIPSPTNAPPTPISPEHAKGPSPPYVDKVEISQRIDEAVPRKLKTPATTKRKGKQSRRASFENSQFSD